MVSTFLKNGIVKLNGDVKEIDEGRAALVDAEEVFAKAFEELL